MKRRSKSANFNLAEKNGLWKGDEVSYGALHDYVKYHLPCSDSCACCGKIGKMDLANISNEYKRDLKDWEWLCRRCHMRKDGRMFTRSARGTFLKRESI